MRSSINRISSSLCYPGPMSMSIPIVSINNSSFIGVHSSLSISGTRSFANQAKAKPEYKLVYFNAKGRTEISRFLFKIAGVEFEDFRYPFDPKTYKCDEFRADKESLPFKRLPILELANGTRLAQAQAIHRFIARRHGLAGANEIEAALTDTVMEVIEEMKQAYVDIVRMTDPEKKKAAATKFFTVQLPDYVQCLNRYADKYGSNGWLIGNKISVADVAFYVWVSVWCPDHRLGFDMTALEKAIGDAPHVRQSVKQVTEHPAVAEWVRVRPQTLT